jgi:complex iron-sulfur molybdoenzyme family reductase subunit alpha
MKSSEKVVGPLPELVTQSRRKFLKRLLASSTLLTLNYSPAIVSAAASLADKPYRDFEDVYRKKWTWDRVVRGTHGSNCAGNCAFNVFVKNGIVWREEQQGEYGSSGDAPDYGPRGCQKGLRHAKYMYGPQRVLYPMKSIGERGNGKWERIS